MAIIDVDDPLRLSDDFLNEYREKPPPWGFGAMSWLVYKRTYARWLDPEAREQTEQWWQTCRRVVEGMFEVLQWRCERMMLPWDEDKAQDFAREAYDRLFHFKWTPPGRGLWAMGTDFVREDGGAALNNCGFASTDGLLADFSGPFAWTFQMLMLGVGVGFDTRGAGELKLEPDSTTESTELHVVGDSREGWTEALSRYLEAQANGERDGIEFDYSEVRPKGEPIKRFGGTASGPEPLKRMFRNMDECFERCRRENDGVVDARLITDLFNIIGTCVVAGNVRRSAELALGDWDDHQFQGLKDSSMRDERPWMWASNNSLDMDGLNGNESYSGNYEEFIDPIAETGEPGFFWSDTARYNGRLADEHDHSDSREVVGTNPCGEQTLFDRELCCLVETYPAHHDGLDDYLSSLKFAYMYAKAVTLIPTHSERTNEVMRANGRIGCSMSGIVQNVQKRGLSEHMDWCRTAYERVQELDKKYSRWLCAPRAQKTTSVKPSGTVSLLAGATPGIHHAHSPYFIRRIRVDENSPTWRWCEKAGYPVEDDANSEGTKVVEFPVKVEGQARSKFEVSVWEQFALAARHQEYWADNQVSCTVTFSEDEVEDLAPALSMFEDKLKSISLLPEEPGAYDQAPYEAIDRDEYERRRAEVDREVLFAGDGTDVPHEREDRYCSGESCEV